MKAPNATIMILLGLGVAYGQGQPTISGGRPFPTDNRPLTAEEWRLKLVAQLMELPSPVTNGVIQLRGMGDEAAVDVIKVLGEKGSPATLEELQSSLDVVHMAFEHPGSIASPVDERPRAALFLLQYLAATTVDEGLKQRIAVELQLLHALTIRLDAVGERQ